MPCLSCMLFSVKWRWTPKLCDKYGQTLQIWLRLDCCEDAHLLMLGICNLQFKNDYQEFHQEQELRT